MGKAKRWGQGLEGKVGKGAMSLLCIHLCLFFMGIMANP